MVRGYEGCLKRNLEKRALHFEVRRCPNVLRSSRIILHFRNEPSKGG